MFNRFHRSFLVARAQEWGSIQMKLLPMELLSRVASSQGKHPLIIWYLLIYPLWHWESKQWVSRAKGLKHNLLNQIEIDVGGVFNWLIKHNIPLPTQRSEIFSTATNNQSTGLIKVFQADHWFTRDNLLLGTFELSRIPPAAPGVPQIQVIFEVDNNGVISVSAYNREMQ